MQEPDCDTSLEVVVLANTHSLYSATVLLLIVCSQGAQKLATRVTHNRAMPTPLDRATSQRVGAFWSWNLIYIVCILVRWTLKC